MRALCPLAFALTLASAPAHAASLDLLEVGGLWGTPTATGPTAVWWNPGAMSGGSGTRFLFELAPTIGGVTIDRDDPNYSDDTDFSGSETFSTVQPIPFLGVVSDFGVPGLGVGLAGFVPMGRGGSSTSEEPGASRTHLRDALILPLHASLSVSYGLENVFGIGASVTYIHSTWQATLDNETSTQLLDFAAETLPALFPVAEAAITDTTIEDPSYLAAVNFGPLTDHRVSFQVGAWGRVHDKVTLGAGFAYGTQVNHRGSTTIALGCPDDPLVAGLMEQRQLCNNTFSTTNSRIAYRYPMRAHLGIAVEPEPDTKVELMAGWVGWSQFVDFAITVQDLEAAEGEVAAEDLLTLEQDRLWARDNRDSFWVGIDAKGNVHEQVLLGGRALFDRSAVPDKAMSPNNADFDTIQLGALIAVQPSKKVPLQIGVSFTEHIQLPRTVTENSFSVTVDPEQRNADRYLWPKMNGRYSGQLHRVGISLRGNFDDKPKRIK